MRHLSPRDLADALGVSESSLKRWVDAGKIVAFRTEGGHRRIALNEAVRFIRATNAPIARPELLGMSEIAVAQRALTSGDQLLDYLLEGDVVATRGFLLARYLGGSAIAELADGPIREAMQTIGELWRDSERGIFIEHRATDTCLQAVAYLRNMVDPPENAPLALGGGPEDDAHLLPSFLAATVIATAGFRVVNLGADTPLAALQHAVQHHHPRLVWMSATMPINPARAKSISRWLSSLGPSTTAVVGGRHSAALVSRGVIHVQTMTELAALAARIVAPSPRAAAHH
jgi:MerR family transcriptional regulator, light-induced transcriptional regulator